MHGNAKRSRIILVK